MLVIIASIAAAALSQQSPFPYTAQCLAEVGAMSGETFLMNDEVTRSGATAKADALMKSSADLKDALDQWDREAETVLADMKRRETAQEVPAGSATLTMQQIRTERSALRSGLARVDIAAPSCDWPVDGEYLSRTPAFLTEAAPGG